jgi:hypothetical protein
MAQGIITLTIKGTAWMIKRNAEGYFHRPIGGDRTWKHGLPSTAVAEEVETVFQRQYAKETH